MYDRRIPFAAGAIALLCCASLSAASELVTAAEAGDLAAVNQLLNQRPSLLNAPDAAGRTPLHAAVARKHVAVMASLLQHGADCRSKDAQGRTAMALAARSGSEELAERMLLLIPDIDLVQAAKSGDVDAVALVIAGDRDRINLAPPLLWSYSPEAVPLPMAIANNQPHVVQLLMAAGARSDSALYRIGNAAASGQIDVLRAYVQAGGDVNVVMDAWYGAPLHRAAGAGRLDVVRFLLDAGAKVNLDADHYTALHAAAWGGHTATVEALLAAGAGLDAAQTCGWRAVHCALWQDHREIVDTSP